MTKVEVNARLVRLDGNRRSQLIVAGSKQYSGSGGAAGGVVQY